ncbi:MAG: hydrogenase expression/formation protein HypE [Gemmatimonadota bacterium]
MSGVECPVPLGPGEHILLAHGGGGRLTRDLIEKELLPALRNPALEPLADGAVLDVPPGRLAFTTDSFVVQPLFFPGGDIGTLAVNGTVNDLAMCGAEPLYLSLGLILEEGLAVADLRRVVASIAQAARVARVHVVTGDTKVVERGKGDGVFVHTSGVGVVRAKGPLGAKEVRPGDAVLVSGPIGQHGVAVMAVRDGLAFSSPIRSDCAPVADAVMALIDAGVTLRCLRDPTRGGVASALNEIAAQAAVEIELQEPALPVTDEVAGVCEVLGLDPLYVACEGRFLAFVAGEDAERAVEVLRGREDCRGAARIATVKRASAGLVTVRTGIGGVRVVDMLSGEQLPRIC